MTGQLLIFTDLDGTLLTHDDYAWQPARQALARLRKSQIPLILNSSKTAAEMVALRDELGNNAPYIVENGGAVILPPGSLDLQGNIPNREKTHSFGHSYPIIQVTLEGLRRQHGFSFRGFADLGVDGIMRTTGLTREAAALAAERHCSEPLLWDDAPDALEAFRRELHKTRLQLVRGGRFWHVMGEGDKGKALNWLADLYRQTFPATDWTTVALGDSDNDLPMLREADIAVVIPPHNGAPLQLDNHPRVLRPQQQGPVGWQQAIDEILNDLH